MRTVHMQRQLYLLLLLLELALRVYPFVICHGEILQDCIGDAGLSLQEMTKTKRFTAFPGGAPANVACGLSKLGEKVHFAGAVGDDDNGAILRKLLQDHRIETACLTSEPGGATRTVMVTRDDKGERTFAGFGGPAALCSCDFADALYTPPPNVDLSGVTWLVQGTLGLACDASAAAHEHFTTRVQEEGGLTLLDINFRDVFWNLDSESPNLTPKTMSKWGWEGDARTRIKALADRMDVIKLTDEEAVWLGIAESREEAMAKPGQVREAFASAKAVLVTAGEGGASYDVLGHSGRYASFDIQAVETTGAGDAFTAGFLHLMKDFEGWALPAGEELSSGAKAQVDEAVLFASAVGALTCCGEGAIAAQPTNAQAVRDFILSKQG